MCVRMTCFECADKFNYRLQLTNTNTHAICQKLGVAHIRVSDVVSSFQTYLLFRLTRAHLSRLSPHLKDSLDKLCFHLLEFVVTLVAFYSRLPLRHPGRFQAISIIEGLDATLGEFCLTRNTLKTSRDLCPDRRLQVTFTC